MVIDCGNYASPFLCTVEVATHAMRTVTCRPNSFTDSVETLTKEVFCK